MIFEHSLSSIRATPRRFKREKSANTGILHTAVNHPAPNYNSLFISVLRKDFNSKTYIFQNLPTKKIYMEVLKIPFSLNWRKRSIQFKLRWFSPELTPLCMHEISIILFPSREFWILLTACQHNSVTPLGGPRRSLKTRNGLRAEKAKE